MSNGLSPTRVAALMPISCLGFGQTPGGDSRRADLEHLLRVLPPTSVKFTGA